MSIGIKDFYSQEGKGNMIRKFPPSLLPIGSVISVTEGPRQFMGCIIKIQKEIKDGQGR